MLRARIERQNTHFGVLCIIILSLLHMESPSDERTVESVLLNLSRATTDDVNRDGVFDAAVSPPERQQMQKELAHFEMLMKNRDSQSIIVDDGVLQQIRFPYDESVALVPSDVVTSVRNKRASAKEKDKRKFHKQSKARRERQGKKRRPPIRELDETVLKEVVSAKVLQDSDPNTSPMLAAILRHIDFAGVWTDEYETGSDEREPSDMETVTVAVEVGLC